MEKIKIADQSGSSGWWVGASFLLVSGLINWPCLGAIKMRRRLNQRGLHLS